MSALFYNTSDIARKLNTNNEKVIYHANKLGLKPCGKIDSKPSSHKPGKVWKAKTFRKLQKHFRKLAV